MPYHNSKRRKSPRIQRTLTQRQRDLVLTLFGVLAGATIGQAYSLTTQAGFMLAKLSQQSENFQVSVMLRY